MRKPCLKQRKEYQHDGGNLSSTMPENPLFGSLEDKGV